MRTENLFIQILQRSQAPPLASSRNSKQAKELESFIIEKREGFMYALIGRKWQPNSSILAWKISWAKEPGGLQSVRSQRLGHD